MLEIGSLIKGKITEEADDVRYMDCRPSVVFPPLTYQDLHVGAVVDTVVLNLKVNGAYLGLFHCDKATYKSVEVNWFDIDESVTNKNSVKDVLKKGDKV